MAAVGAQRSRDKAVGAMSVSVALSASGRAGCPAAGTAMTRTGLVMCPP